MTEKRFVLERSDYDLKYEFRVADTSKVKKTKEDFWNEEEEIYEYRKYIAYLLENDAFLTLDEADELLNALHNENEQLEQDNNVLIHLLENQSIIIQELSSKISEYQLKEPITLTKEDIEVMGRAISYYTHGRCYE